jgi:serine/threonine-protein kinase
VSASLSQGRVIEERYKLLSRLGEGSAGTVWLAEDLALHITVAVKVLRPELSLRKAMLEQFDREAELSARMLSPNIVRVLARGVDADGTPYIVYEALDGEDLGTRLARTPRLDLAETETVVIHVARALSRAHAVGVIHRDIKPENLFVTKDEDGRALVKVLDFGLAELQAKLGATDALSGTIELMAPEVMLDGVAPDARSDLYSLAVVAYRCLAGAMPFPGDVIGQVVLALTTTTPRKPSEILGPCATAIDAWFERALARDPARRFESARELAETFHAAAKDARFAAPSARSGEHSSIRRSISEETIRVTRDTVRLKRVDGAVVITSPAPDKVMSSRPPAAVVTPPPARQRAQSFIFEEETPSPDDPPNLRRSPSGKMQILEVDATDVDADSKDERRR